MKCIYCGGEVRPLEEFFKLQGEENYNFMKAEWKRVMGIEWKISNDFNCLECGQVYDELLIPKALKLGWAKK